MWLHLWRDVCTVGRGLSPAALDLGPSDLSSLLVETHNFILKFTWKFKGTRRAKTVVRKPGLCTLWSGAQQLGGHCSTGVGVRGQAEHRNRQTSRACASSSSNANQSRKGRHVRGGEGPQDTMSRWGDRDLSRVVLVSRVSTCQMTRSRAHSCGEDKTV